MDYRIGKCSQCGAEYKIPASFAHDRARCKECQGVVNIAPFAAPAAPPPPARAPAPPPDAPSVPARKVVPSPAAERPQAPTPPAPQPSAPPRTDKDPEARPAGRPGGTLERLKAQRRAEAEARAAQASAPAPEKPAAARPAPSAPAARPTAATSARSASPAKGSRRPGAEKPGRAERPGRGRSGARGGGRSRAGGDKKKRSPVGLISVVALLVLGGAAFLLRDTLFGSGKGSEVAAAGEESATPATEAPAPVPEAEAKTPEPEPEPATPEPKAEPEAKAPKTRDPASIDLEAVPDLARTPDTSDEEWATMQTQMEQWMDRDAGAAANRARTALIAQGRKAMPAMLNTFKRLDFATPEGRANGDLIQKTMMGICNGTNFDWRYADPDKGHPIDNPDDVWFCKRVVELWINSWKQGEQNIEAWINMAKLNEKDPEEAARLRAEFGKKTATGESAEPVVSGSDADLEVD